MNLPGSTARFSSRGRNLRRARWGRTQHGCTCNFAGRFLKAGKLHSGSCLCPGLDSRKGVRTYCERVRKRLRLRKCINCEGSGREGFPAGPRGTTAQFRQRIHNLRRAGGQRADRGATWKLRRKVSEDGKDSFGKLVLSGFACVQKGANTLRTRAGVSSVRRPLLLSPSKASKTNLRGATAQIFFQSGPNLRRVSRQHSRRARDVELRAEGPENEGDSRGSCLQAGLAARERVEDKRGGVSGSAPMLVEPVNGM